MEPTEEFRQLLDVPIARLSINGLVQKVCNRPQLLATIYGLTADEKLAVSWRAIWVCEKLSEIHPEWFVALYDEIIDKLLNCLHDGSKRLWLSVLYNLPLPTPIPIRLLNYCLDQMLSPHESIAVQALSIKMAHLLCQTDTDLLRELKTILENTETDFYSSGVKSTIRNVLKKIKK